MDCAKEVKLRKVGITCWTSIIRNYITKHKFVMMLISMFVSFSFLNIFLILNFVSLLEKMYI